MARLHIVIPYQSSFHRDKIIVERIVRIMSLDFQSSFHRAFASSTFTTYSCSTFNPLFIEIPAYKLVPLKVVPLNFQSSFHRAKFSENVKYTIRFVGFQSSFHRVYSLRDMEPVIFHVYNFQSSFHRANH